MTLQENVDREALAISKHAAAANAAGKGQKSAKVLAVMPGSGVKKAPLQPLQLNINVDSPTQSMGPPPPRKPPSQEQIVEAQVQNCINSTPRPLTIFLRPK